MSMDKYTRFKDPFSTAPLPKSFYCPTPTKDVDTNVMIQSTERKDWLSKNEDITKPSKTGSSFLLASQLPLIDIIPKDLVSSDPFENLSDINDDGIPSGCEQPSNSTFLDNSNLTSSIDEKERMRTVFHERDKLENSRPQDASVSVIQKYIERFRYSAPKSREERERDSDKKRNTFWWLDSNKPTSVVRDAPQNRLTQLPTTAQGTALKQNNGTKLTREAVLELDKETSDLQQKADKILSISQMSLASSGPCVSTDGLGSSSAFSEGSYRSDRQPAYRPIFINTQGEYPSIAKDSYSRIEGKEPDPQDVLTRWRMRKKTRDVHQQSTQISSKRRPMKSATEIDIRLEEFRKKLFAQRALVTSEDIQFERQKMKMIMEDETDEIKNQKEVMKEDKNVSQSNTTPIGDPVLARLWKITGTVGSSGDCSASHHLKLGNNCRIGATRCDNCSDSFNSNNVNSSHRNSNNLITSSSNEPATLNTNNRASDEGHFNSMNDVTSFSIDEMKSMSVCDAKQKTFSLRSNPTSPKNSDSSLSRNSLKHVSKEPGSGDQNDWKNKKIHSNTNPGHLTEDKGFSDVGQHEPYHQRLQAEKPCDDTSSSTYNKGNDRQSNWGGGNKSSCTKDKEGGVFSEETEFQDNNSSKSDKLDKCLPQNRERCELDAVAIRSVAKAVNDAPNDVPLQIPEKLSHSATTSTRRVKDESGNCDHACLDVILTESNAIAPKHKQRITQGSHSVPKLRKESCDTERNISSSSKPSPPSKVHTAIGETVVDHLFDGPSMISSVDSWASLFPQSPAHSHSFHNSMTVTPSKDQAPCEHITSTPHNDSAAPVSHENNVSDDDASEEFSHDPLMNLLQHQKKEYIRKLELIEKKLQELENTEK